MSTPFYWGIIGLGKIARAFAEDLQQIPNARLAAVASRSGDRAHAFAREFNAEFAYGNYADILHSPRLDAVYIATPHVSHAELSIMCLDVGIPVLCEKPWAMNSREAEDMVQKAREKGTFLMEAVWTRFLPTTKAILDIINQGQIGEVLGVKADFGFALKDDPPQRLIVPALGGGALLDIGLYPVFLSQLLLGKPSEIVAMSQLSDRGIDLETGMILKYPGAKLAHLHASLLAKTKTEAFIYGKTGTIHWHSRWHEPSSFSLIKEDERPQLFQFDYPSNGYHYETLAVMDAVGKGLKEHPDLPLDFSLGMTKVLDRIRSACNIVYPSDARS